MKWPLLLLAVIAMLSFAGPPLGTALGIDPNAVELLDRFAGSSPLHPLGTDELGRDVLLRVTFTIGQAVVRSAPLTTTDSGTPSGRIMSKFTSRAVLPSGNSGCWV